MLKKLTFVIFCILVFSFGLLATYFFFKKNEASNTAELGSLIKNIRPTNTTYGKVGAIKNDGSFQILLNDTVTNDSGEYTILTTPETIFSHKRPEIPYLYKDEADKSPLKASYSDIKTGMSVEVSTQDDLSASELIANSILLPRPPYILQGIVKEKTATTITVDAAPVLEINETGGLPPHSTYVIEIVPETEISRQVGGESDNPNAEKKQFKVSDIAIDQMVIVYSFDNVLDSTNLRAGRIEPII